ncbi:MAG: CHASE domain-containing protein [Actinomycetota bacterium]
MSAQFGGSPGSSPGSGPSTTRATRLALWIAVLGVVVSSFAAYWVWDRTVRAADDAVTKAADLLTDSITFAFGEVVDQLVAVAGLYQASDRVDRSEFIRFVEKLGVEAGVQGLAFAPKLDADDVPDFLDSVRDTIPDYEIQEFDSMGGSVPARPRDTHIPIQWMYPEGIWDNPYGFDLASFPIAAASFPEARETGDVAATPFFRLPDGADDTESLLLLQPIERIDNSEVDGYAIALVDLGPFLDSHLPRGLDDTVRWEISDGTTAPDLPSPDWTTPFAIAGDRWQIAVAGKPGSATVADPSSAVFVLAAGIVTSLLAAFGFSAYRQRTEAGVEVERLRELSRAKDRFLASVGHELRTPLTGVVGFASLLCDPDSNLTAEEEEKMIESISRESTDLAAIIDDLLVAARSELDMVTVTSEPLDLRELVEGVLETTREEKARDVAVVSEDDVWAAGDPARTRQIVRNLLVNACRYGGERIEMRLARDGGDVVLQVADAGAGIPRYEWDRIFEPYYRAHSAETMPAALGIGLSVSRHLSRLMGGDLTYRHEDGWSVFELRLRAADASREKTPLSDLSETSH